MQEWTINNVSLADLGIDSLQLHLQNQDDDYVDIRFPRNYDAALPDGFDVDAPIVVRFGSTVVFRGEVATLFQPAGAFAEYRSVFAYGPWHRFREMPFLYMYPYVTGDALSTHGVLGGDANDLLTAILTTNTADIVQIGTIDVGTLTVPEQEIYDQTLAQTLQSILRFVTGAQVVFDYQTDPPTIHILADNSETLTTVTLEPNDGSVSNLRAAPLYSRLVDGVTLQYEVTGSVCSAYQIFFQAGGYTSTIDAPDCASGFYIAGTDSAGDANSRRHFRRTLKIDGTYEHSIYQLTGQLWTYQPFRSVRGGPYTFEDFIDLTAESGNTYNNTRLMVDRAKFFSIFWDSTADFYFSTASVARSAQNVGSLSGSAEFISDGPEGTWTRYCRPLMQIGSNHLTIPAAIETGTRCIWQQDKLASAFFQSGGVSGLRVLASAYRWDFTNTNGLVGDARQSTTDAHRVLWIDTRTVGAVNSATGEFNYMKAVTSSIPTPSGIAAQILAANSRLLWEGGATVRRYDAPLLFLGLARRLHISTLEADTVIQRTTIDTATGQVDLTFGAPTHLGPQDLIALQRAGKSPA